METQSSKDLEFTTVMEGYARHCLSPEGREHLLALPLVKDQQELAGRKAYIAEFLRLIGSGMVKLPESFPDTDGAFDRLSDISYHPEGSTLHAIASYIRQAVRFAAFTKETLDDKKPMTHITTLFGPGVSPDLVMLSDEIWNTLESDGRVKETHPVIAALLKRVESARSGRTSFARQFINSHKQQVLVEQGALRDGRLVIPMRSDRVGKDQGFISGASGSGNTLFVEPFRLVELNNEVTLASQQIEIETARIIRELADKTRRLCRSLKALSLIVAEADTWYALAQSAHLAHMSQCLCADRVRLLKARHPLLGKKAVPITIDLAQETHAVVLTGPNAGGKTVTIKTVGLLALMNQLCGYIPADEGSMLPMFDQVLTEIGDEQSIENGLSTFSSHMHRIAYALDHMTPDSLLILDELGSGTDPVEGSALARAILEECLGMGCMTFITSHHGVLKEFAYARTDVMNASMAFDESSHEPTFRVVQGVPGDSHALDTAIRQHVPQRVIDRAKGYLGSNTVQIGEIIKGLEKKRQDLDRREVEIKEKEQTLAAEAAKLQEEQISLRQERLKVIDQQDTELGRFLRNKNKELEHLLTDLRGGKGLTAEQQEKTKKFVEGLKSKKNETENWLAKEERKLDRVVPPQSFKVGDHVLCGPMKRKGVVSKMEKGGRVEVQVGSIRMTMKAKDLERDESKVEAQNQHYAMSFESSLPSPKFELDFRGLTLEEALHQLDLQIESCLVHGVTQFGVIHGFGDGILAQGIGRYLDKHPAVKSHEFAPQNDGGMGKTYVYL